MQLVVVMAVKKAVSAATITFTATSINLVMGTGTGIIAAVIPKYLTQ